MTEESKQFYREEKARDAIANWQTCQLSELQSAAKIFDSAILLLIQRMAL